MTLLLEVFAFLAVVMRGAASVAQAVAIGGSLFLIAIALPLRSALGAAGSAIDARTRFGIACAALALGAIEAITAGAKILMLADTTGIAIAEAAGADFALAALIRTLAALALAALAYRVRDAAGVAAIAGTCLLLIAATVALSHAVARPDGRLGLAVATAGHWLAASAWIGGLPFFLFALAQTAGGPAWRAIGRRYTLISLTSVAMLLAAGLFKSVVYIGDTPGIWGTAYGVMVSTKIAMFLALLAFGAANFFAIRRPAAAASDTAQRLRRRTEAEFALGIAVFFLAASLTSVPPATDLPHDRASWADIVERMTPAWPRLASPSHADLSIQRRQAELNSASSVTSDAPRAYIPGSGITVPGSAEDIAWSEFNHNWAGVFVTLIGVVSLLERLFGWRWARGWPLIFIGLAVFLFIRSDPKAWPLGDISFVESLRDAEVLQHRLFILLIVVFGLFEWAVRTGRISGQRPALVFPIVCMVAGGLLLAHTHSIGNFREELLVEITHIPIALLGLAAGAARWLELRLPGQGARVAASVWPVCFLLSGLLLFTYHES
jgi:putative copper resistance protein D